MSETEKLILPPNVKGKSRRFLDLLITNIHWKTSKAYTDVKIRIRWWGETEGILCKGIKIDVNNKKIPEEPLASLRYQIKTNNRLLLSYLKNADPVQLDIYSSKTEDFIGSANFKIPSLVEDNLQKSFKLTSLILSNRQFNLGEITAIMELLPEASTNVSILKNHCEKKGHPFDRKALKECKENKENIQVIGQRKKISFREPKPQKASTLVQKNSGNVKLATELRTDSKSARTNVSFNEDIPIKDKGKSSLISYLSGAPLTVDEEHKIVCNLAEVSPSESVIESLNSVERNLKSNQVADRFDSIRITLYQVELSPAGQRETQNIINKSRLQKCFLKCAVTSKCFTASDDRIISSVFETAPQRISLSREITKRIMKPWNEQGTFVNFGFCVKSNDQQAPPFYLGFSRVDLRDLICSSNGVFHKKCPIIHESDFRVGTLSVKIELGVNELHFGNALIESLQDRFVNETINNDDATHQSKVVRLTDQQVQVRSHPSHSNQCDNKRSFDNKTVQTERDQQTQKHSSGTGEDDEIVVANVEKERVSAKSKVYCGLLFIEGLRNLKDQASASYFITYEGFWNQCQESTEVFTDLTLNYLKQFPVICDDEFLKRVQNNHLELKLWEKTENSEKWVGSTKLPLHQFFIAFRDVAMIEHLSLNQLPIISIDTTVNFVSPLSSELFCQGKVLLAIGRENQIDYLKLLRNMHNLRVPKKSPIPLPDPNAQIKNKLAAFIESLSQNLPEPSSANVFNKPASILSKAPTMKPTSDLVEALQSTSKSSSMTASSISSNSQPEIRKTSDLLDTLQKALSQPPQKPYNEAIALSSETEASNVSDESNPQELVRMRISIEYANHLPKVFKKKANRRKNKNSTTPQKAEFEPSSYVTFESHFGRLNESMLPPNIVKSHEGLVNCTNVIKSCDPQWNQNFDVSLPLDVLTNQQKRFVVKIWRKISDASVMKPAPFEDAVIGFSAIDLSVLLTGLPILSGFYNIIDFASHCHGQIKLSLKPLEDVLQYQDSSTSLPNASSLLHPLSIDVDDSGPNLLSRTLKRKFTELDEITQRLKARLFDVTSEENFDPDDEFERDLNTAADDDMGESNHNDQIDFAWLKQNDNGQNEIDFQSQLDRILGPQPSTSKASSNGSRIVSGCSNPQPIPIDQLLKKYDLDTLINPNIFKNIYDPTLANSDSTPTLNPQPVNTEDIANVSGDSGDTTVSSILSVDQIQTIEKAFQKATLTDGSELSSSRKDPEGENDISE